MQRSILSRLTAPLFVILVIAIPFVIYGAIKAIDSNENRVEDWLPESFVETQQYRWFAKHFISDDILLISWEGCKIHDPRIPELATLLLQPTDVGKGEKVTFFRQVVTSEDGLEILTQPPLDLSEAQAISRLKGWLVGQDGEAACMITMISRPGWEHRHQMDDHINACIDKVAGLKKEKFHIAGSVMDGIAIDIASTHLLVPMMIASYVISFCLMLYLFRSFWLAGVVFLDALFCQQLSLAIIHYSGTDMDSVLLMVPTLVYVLSVSTGVHMVNYYLDALDIEGVDNAPLYALTHAFTPVLLASATTSIGVASLLISFLTPLRSFGWFGAISVLVALAVILVILPCQLNILPHRRRSSKKRVPFSRLKLVTGTWWIAFLTKYPMVIVILALVSLGGALVGISRLQTTARIHDMFGPEESILQDYDWAEQEFAPLVPVEVIVRIPQPKEDLSFVDRLRLISEIQQRLYSVEGIGVVISALNVSPPIPDWEEGGARQIVRQTILNRALEKNQDQFVQLGYLRKTRDEELWRISVRTYSGKAGVDNSKLVKQMKESMEPILASHASQMPGISSVICGSVPLVQKAQEQMLSDLINSFILAFGLIAIMMTAFMFFDSREHFFMLGFAAKGVFLLRCSIAGLLTMIPNVIPCLLVLGAMGLLSLDLEVGSIMTATVALGVAVDDTLHYLSWFRRGFVRYQSRPEAVRYAYRHCAAAMVQTTMICGLGLLVFATSPFVPISRFSCLMFCMLSTALFGDLIVLPALLMSRLGRIFEPLISLQPEKQD